MGMFRQDDAGQRGTDNAENLPLVRAQARHPNTGCLHRPASVVDDRWIGDRDTRTIGRNHARRAYTHSFLLGPRENQLRPQHDHANAPRRSRRAQLPQRSMWATAKKSCSEVSAYSSVVKGSKTRAMRRRARHALQRLFEKTADPHHPSLARVPTPSPTTHLFRSPRAQPPHALVA